MTTSAQNHEGVFATSDYKLTVLTIVTSSGVSLDVSDLMIELDIYEDIFSPVMTGSVTLGDATDIISNLRLHGNEYIVIEVDKPTLGRPISKVFRIYKIADRVAGTTALQNYTIHFCSEELVLSTQTLLNKSYKGLGIDAMVDDILRNVLKVDETKLKDGIFSQTSGTFDLIIPRLQPLAAIEWLTPRAFNTDENLFFFFENRDGFNFTSYENLISKPTYAVYARDVKVSQEPAENMQSYHFLGIEHDFDILNSLRYGAYNSSVLSLDLINRQATVKSFGYADLKPQALLNGNIPVTVLPNRLGFSLFDSLEAMAKFVITTDIDPSMNPADLDNWLPQTSARLAQLHTFKVVMNIPGDVLVKAGMVVGVIMPKMIIQSKVVENDDLRTGRYLVSTVHHKFVEDTMTTTVELLSDSVSVPLGSVATESPLVQKVVKM